MTCVHRSAIDTGNPTATGIETFRVEPTALGMSITCAVGDSPEFSRLVIRYRADGAAPESPRDGSPLLDVPVTPGTLFRGSHHPRFRGFDFIYTVFGLDERGAIRARATTLGSPSAE